MNLHIHTREVHGAYGPYWEATLIAPKTHKPIRACGFTTADAIAELMDMLSYKQDYLRSPNIFGAP